jgi:hypothetical protein
MPPLGGRVGSFYSQTVVEAVDCDYAVMSVEQITTTLLQLPPEERRRFADWFYEHEEELTGPVDIHPDVKAEILRRRDEVDAHPELLEPVTEEWFEQMKSKLANARTAKRFAR